MRWKLGEEVRKIHADLVTVLGDTDPSFDTLPMWTSLFQPGGQSSQDEGRSGRVHKAMNKETFKTVEACKPED